MDNYDKFEIVYDNYKPPPSEHVQLSNPHLTALPHDTLYHLGLSSEHLDLHQAFGDVKFVCMGGKSSRMKSFAQLVAKSLNIVEPLVDLAASSGRYSMFKVGPVLSVSHGMGVSSLSILLHEIIKLVHYARCVNVTFFRMGTSGGINIPQGSVVLTHQAVDEFIRPFYELRIMNKIIRRPCITDLDLVRDLKAIADETDSPTYQTVVGTTMCCMDFYEAQSRLDGAFCHYSFQEKMDRLKQLEQHGVVNIEMEATVFTSMCYRAGIRCAVVCVTLVNRLNGDQLDLSEDTIQEYQMRPLRLVLKYILAKLSN